MAEIVGFSPDNMNRLYSLLQRVRDQEFNYRTRPAYDVDTVYNDPSAAPEVYVVKTPPEGIGYAETAYGDTGTGTDQVLIPGYAQCQFLTFRERFPEDSELHPIDSLTNTVYNLGSDEIDGDTYILAVRIKSGQYIAIRLFPPDTGTESFDTDCHLRIDNSNKIFLNVPTLAGPGLYTTSTGTGTGTCWTLGIDTGCTTYVDDDNKLQVDVEAIAGDGLEATTGTGTDCKYLKLKYGCHFYIDSQGRLQLDVAALVGRGLSTGTGTCPTLNVDTNDDTGTSAYDCHFTLDQDGRVRLNLASIAGQYLEVNGTSSCQALDVVIPLGCGLAYDILTGAIYVDFDDVVGTALSWGNCRLSVLFDCHLLVDEDNQLGVDVASLAGDNTETGLKKYDANPCSPLSNDYVVAREDEKFYVADDRTLMVGTVLTQFQVLRLEKRTFNAANELIGWEDLGETLVTREIVDLCTVCDTGTGTGTSTGTVTPGYFCFYYEVTYFPFDSVVYGPLCAQLTEEQVTALENDGAVFFGGPFDTYEECDEFCPDTGTANPGCDTVADCGTELFVSTLQNGSTTADLCTAYSIVIPETGTYKITATHTSGSSDVELRWLAGCESGLTLAVEDFSGTTACINLGTQPACEVLYFCVTRTGGSGSQGFSLIVAPGTC